MKDKNMYLRKKKAENLNNILVCENCGEQQISVCDSRMSAGTRRRRRICNVCGHKSTTYEISNEEFERLLNEGENQKVKYNHGYTKGHSDGYAKAIDEFVKEIEAKYDNDGCPNVLDYLDYKISIRDLHKIAKYLEGGV